MKVSVIMYLVRLCNKFTNFFFQFKKEFFEQVNGIFCNNVNQFLCNKEMQENHTIAATIIQQFVVTNCSKGRPGSIVTETLKNGIFIKIRA